MKTKVYRISILFIIVSSLLFISFGRNGINVFAEETINSQLSENLNSNLDNEDTSYTVTFDLNGGTGEPPSSQTLKVGSLVGEVSIPVRESYTFLGWNTKSDGLGEELNDEFSMPKEDVSFFAQWQRPSKSKAAITITVTFDLNLGKDPGSEQPPPIVFSVMEGAPIYPYVSITKPGSLSSAPTRNSCPFKGWYIGEDKLTTLSEIYSDVTYQARWGCTGSYFVILSSNGGSALTTTDYVRRYDELVFQESPNIEDPTKTNYTFGGWFFEGQEYTRTTKMPNNIVSLKAKWIPNKYKLTFDTNGGSTPLADKQVDFDSIALKDVEDPTKTGYTFDGWYAGTTLYIATSKMPGSDITLKVKWLINSYTVTFDTDGGSMPPNSKEVDFNALPLTGIAAPTKTGHTFDGWYVGTTIYTSTSKMPANDIILKAKWVINNYAVSFDTNGGSTAPTSKQVEFDATPLTGVVNPTKIGHTFDGWYVGLDNYISTTKMPANDITLEAKWLINKYTVTFDSDGGSGSNAPASKQVEFEAYPVAAITNPIKDGHSFDGWYDGADKYISTTKMPAKNVALKAKWVVNVFEVSFDTDGGSLEPLTMNVTVGVIVSIVDIDIPTKSGYKFDGWYNGQVKITSTITMPNHDLVIKAKWIERVKPVITVETFTVINLDAVFNPKTGASAIDDVDGNLTNEIDIDNTVDTAVVGVYKVIYSVKNLANKEAIVTRVVIVKDNSVVIGANHVLLASDFKVTKSNVKTSDADIKAAANVRLYNLLGELQDVSLVKILSKNGYNNTVGSYQIKFAVISDATVNVEIKATVITGDFPVITLPNQGMPVFIVKDSVYTAFTGVTVSDTEDATNSISLWSDPLVINTQIPGVFQIKLYAEDTDGNRTESTRVIVVSAPGILKGDDYIISASDFTVNRSNVLTTEASVKSLANLQIHNLAGVLVNVPVTVDMGGYNNATGEYTIKFTVTDDIKASVSVKGKVTSGSTPELTTQNFVELDKDAEFVAIDYITTAKDVEDGDNLASSVVDDSKTSLDMSTSGVYTVTYTLTDKDFNVVTSRLNVVVKGESVAVGENFYINANDFTIRVGQFNNDETVIKNLAKLTLYSKSTNLPVNNKVNIVSNGGFTNVAGIYKIKFSVENELSLTTEINATVIKGDSPVLSIGAQTVELALNAAFNPATGVSAVDTEDGLLTNSIVIEPKVISTAVIGVFPITYSITDSDGNVTIAIKVVIVNDGSIIKGDNLLLEAKDFELYVSEVDTSINGIMKAANVKLYDANGKLLNNNVVKIDEDCDYSDAPGEYDITFTAVNDTNLSITIKGTVISGEPPVITLPNEGKPVELNLNQAFDTFDGVVISDEEDDAKEVELEKWSTPEELKTDVPGIYVIELNVIDSDLNVTTVERVVIVKDATIKMGDNYIIRANDFTVNLGNVVATEAAVKALANVKVLDFSGNIVDVPVVTELGDYDKVIGEYSINFSVKNDLKATTTINGKVIGGNAPVLTTVGYVEVDMNSTFDPKDHIVEASDTEDGPLTNEVSDNSKDVLDMAVPGVYVITYSVTDSDNNTTTAQLTVVVKGGSIVIGESFIIRANDFTIRKGQFSSSESNIKLNAKVTVYSKETGLPVNSSVSVKSLGGYTQAIGEYSIKFEVDDEPLINITIKAKIISGEAPVISVNESRIILGIDDEIDLLDGVTAADAEDDDNTLVITTNPESIDTSRNGVHEVNYTVTDSDGNTDTISNIVIVKDNSVIISDDLILVANDFELLVSKVNTSDAGIRAAANVELYDIDGNKLNNDKVSVTKNSYGALPGNYKILFTAVSDSNVTVEVNAEVLTGNLPEIKLPNSGNPVEIAKGTAYTPFTGVLVSDVEDDANNVAITKTSNPVEIDVNTAGIYTISLSVRDADNNVTTINRVVVVKDAGVIVGDTYIIKAKDFTVNISRVIVDVATVKSLADVKVYNYAGEVVDKEVITDLGVYDKIIGEYIIKFTVKDDTKATTSIKANVKSGNAPVLTIQNYFEMTTTENFFPNDFIENVEDVEDTDLSESDVTNDSLTSFNKTVPGVYRITYSVTDSDGNETTAVLVVLVKGTNLITNADYILKASDFTLRVSQVSLASDSIKIDAKATIYSKETGLPVNKTINISDLGDYTNIVGVYSITFSDATDSNMKVTIKASVVNGESPVLDIGEQRVILNKNDEFDLKVGISANDEEDGPLTNSVSINPTTIDTSVIGVNAIKYTITDKDGNETSATKVVIVKDYSVIIGDNYIIQADNFERVISKVSQNVVAIKLAANVKLYDLDGNLLDNTNVDITSTEGYRNAIGQYKIKFTAKDDAKAAIEIIGKVVTGNLPEIKLPNSGAILQIDKGTNVNVLAGVTVTDVEDDTDELTINLSASPATIDTNEPGIYRIKVSAKDSDNNITDVYRVIIVKDAGILIGEDYIIHAQDFTVSVGNVVVDADIVKGLANVKVTDLNGNVVNPKVNVDLGDYKKEIASYDIKFSIEAEPTTTVIVKGKVNGGNVPELKVDEYTEMRLGEKFYPQYYIDSAEDVEDGDLIDEVKNDSLDSLKVDVPGVYRVTYSVTDFDGNEVKAILVVVIKGSSLIIGDKYIIEATDFSIRRGQVNTALANIVSEAGLSVYLKETGLKVVDNVEVTDLGDYTSVAGDYNIILGVKNETTTRITVKASVSIGEVPVLSIGNNTVTINVDDKIDLTTGVSATDVEDDNSSLDIFIEPETIDTSVSGVHRVKYSVSDSDGNTTEAYKLVIVAGGSTVIGEKYIITASNFEKLVSEVKTTDNDIKRDAKLEVFSIDGTLLSNSIVTITEDSEYSNVPGTYKIKFTVNDAENSVSVEIDAKVITGDAPVITLPNNGSPVVVAKDSIYKPLDAITVTDVEDDANEIATKVSSSPTTLNTEIPGVYSFEISAIDRDKNVTSVTRVIIVKDETVVLGEKFTIVAKDFRISFGRVVADNDIVKGLASVLVYDLDGNKVEEPVSVNLGEYSKNIGEYDISFTVTADESATVKVVGEVFGGNPPVMEIVDYAEIGKGGNFFPMDYVNKALDAEDNDLMDEVRHNATGYVNMNVPGVYVVTYSVTDKDENTVTANLRLIVTGDSVVIGEKYILNAEDFSVRVGALSTAYKFIRNASNVRVYDKATGELVNVTVEVKSNDFTNLIGEYKIEFTVKEEPTTTITVKATVITGESPFINIGDPVTLVKLDAVYDPASGVTAIDDEDKDLIEELYIDNTVIDTTVIGAHTINYSVTDSDGNSTSKRKTVIVYEGSAVLGEEYVLTASDYKILSSQVDKTDSVLKSLAKVRIYDLKGKLLSNGLLDSRPNNAYSDYPEVYPVRFQLKTLPSFNITIKGEVTRGNAPVIRLPNSGKPYEVAKGADFTVLENVAFEDVEDDITNVSLNITANPSTINTEVPGIYKVAITATDTDGNITRVTQVIVVKDDGSVVGEKFILMANNFSVYKEKVIIDEDAVKVLANVKVYDLAGNLVQNDVSVTLGDYSEIVGKYDIKISVVDDLKAASTVVASVTNGAIPVLKIYNYMEITTTYNFQPNMFILEASDVEDGSDLKSTVTNDAATSVKNTVPGVYKLTYTLTDKDLNKVEKVMTVVVLGASTATSENYVIDAHGYTIRAGQFSDDVDVISANAGVTIYSIETCEVIEKEVIITSLGGFKNEAGEYEITIAIKDEPKASSKIKVKVLAGEGPTITIDETRTEVKVGEVVDLKKGLTASDLEDGAINNRIVSDPLVLDTQKPGFITVNYTVTDTDGNKATAKKLFIINDGSLIIGKRHIISASSFEKRVSEVNKNLNAIKNAANVKLYDLNGNILSNDKVKITYDGAYQAKVGEYEIHFTSENDTYAFVAIKAKVVAGNAPTIELPNDGKPYEVEKGAEFYTFDDVIVKDKEDDLGGFEVTIWTDPEEIDTEVPGIYKITLYAKDYDDNITTMDRIVVVNDGSFVVGDDYIIQANDFTVKYKLVEVNESKVKELAAVKVFDLDGTEVEVTVNTNLGDYRKNVGVYPIVFTVADDEAASIEIKGKVSADNLPVLKVTEYIELAKDAEFIPEEYIEEASDVEDGDLTKAVSNDSEFSLDMTKAGVYVVTYTVADKDENTVSKELIVVVKDSSIVIGDNYIIKANDFKLRVGQVSVLLEKIKADAKVVVYLKETGRPVVDKVKITEDSDYTDVVGEYAITFAVTEEDKVAITIDATVISGDSPEIDYDDSLLVLAIDDEFDPKKDVTASDTEDLDLTEEVIVSPEKIETSVAGVYNVTYTVTDSDKNTTTGNRVVVVKDDSIVITDKYIIEAKDFDVLVSKVDTSDNAIKNRAKLKLYDLNGALQNNNLVEITEKGDYSSTPGVYDIIFTAISDVKATIGIKATVKTGNVPVITMPNEGNPTFIDKEADFDVFEDVEITDVEDDLNEVAIEVSANPTSIDTKVPGVYQIIITATDADNNVTKKARVVIVEGNEVNVGDEYIISANNYTINYSNVNLDKDVVKGLAKVVVYDLNGDVVDVNVLVDLGTYTQAVGVYNIKFTVEDDSTATVNVKANVIAGNLPVLKVQEYIELNINDAFVANEFVKEASDIEDGPMISKVANDSSTSLKMDKAGVYRVTYSLTDKDENSVSKVAVVTVKDASVVTSANYILMANYFKLRVGEVVKTSDAIKNNANVKVYSKATGNIVNKTVNITEDSGYTKAVGEYNITFVLEEEIAAKIIIKATVISGELPIIEIKDTTTYLNVDDTFDIMENVTAKDTEDDVLTDEIDVDPEAIDTSVAGVTQVTYTVTDSDGNTTSLSKVVIVRGSQVVIGDSLIIVAYDFEKLVSAVNTSVAGIKAAAGLKLYDLQGTPLNISNVDITEDSDYSDTPGSYAITFVAKNDGKAKITINGVVIKGNSPVIELPNDGLPVQINQDDEFDVLNEIKVTDVEDDANDITIKLSADPVSIDTSIPGVYRITLNAEDSDKNVTVINRVVVVKGNGISVGENYIITAKDYTINYKRVEVDAELVKVLANVKVYDFDGKVVDKKVLVDLGEYSVEVAKYDITFIVKEDSLAKTKIEANVVGGNVPVLKVDEYVELDLNDEFDADSYISEASDIEDGPLTDEVTNDSNTSLKTDIAGVYVVTYTLTDSDLNVITATLTVVVKDKTVVIGDKYILVANDFTVRIGQVSTTLKSIATNSTLKVYDKVTGLLVDVEVEVKDLGGYKNIIGDYNITLNLKLEPTTKITVKSSVIKGEAPTIEFDEPVTLIPLNGEFDAKSGVKASDKEDGDLIKKLVATPETIATEVIGLHKVEYVVTDTDGNTTTAKKLFIITDDTYTIGESYIIKANNFEKLVSKVNVAEDAIKIDANVKLYDYDGNVLSTDLVKIKNDSDYEAKAGSYDITFTTEEDDNAVITITALIKTGNVPVIKLPNNAAPYIVDKNAEIDIFDHVLVSDVEDDANGLVVKTWSDPTTLSTEVPGVYTVKLFAEDIDKNVTTINRVIIVRDSSIVVGDKYIITAEDFTINFSDVDKSDSEVLKQAKVIVYDLKGDIVDLDDVKITVDIGDYTNLVGEYTIKFTIKDDENATVEVVANVVAGNLPELKVKDYIELTKGEEFIASEHILKAMDVEDGDLTDDVKDDSLTSLDMNVPDVYRVKYTLTDKDNNKVEATLTVVVKGDSLQISENYIIKASDFKLLVRDVNTNHNVIKTNAKVTVYSKETGLPVEKEVRISSDGGYKQVVGIYGITFEVVEETDAKVTVKANVVGGTVPVITFDSLITEVMLNTVYDLSVGVSALDKEDGDLTTDISVDPTTLDTSKAGLKRVKYSVTDKDLNTVVAYKTYVINDGTYSVGDNLILQALDFSILVSDVNTSEAGIKKEANLKLYDVNGQLLSNDKVNITYDSGYRAAVGSYKIKFTAKSDAKVNLEIIGVVTTGNYPVITLPNEYIFSVLNQNSDFDTFDDVRVSDIEDDANDIQVKTWSNPSLIDTTKPGIYKIKLYAEDADKNITTLDRVLVVKDKGIIVGDKYIITANDFTINTGNVVVDPAIVNDLAKVEVYDFEGNLVDVPVTVDLGSYNSDLGNHIVKFTVKDDLKATTEINANVISGNIPILKVRDYVALDVLNKFTAKDYIIEASDVESDGDLSGKVTNDSRSSLNMNKAGVYRVTYSLIDEDGNKVTAVLIVVVKGSSVVVGDKYLITANDFTLRKGQVNKADVAILDKAKVVVYSKETGLQVNAKVNISDKGGYDNVVGKYNITFVLADETTTKITVNAKVVSGEYPVITMDQTIVKLKLNDDFDPKLGVTASDKEDGNLNDKILVSPLIVDTSKVGVNTITYTVTDKDGNITIAKKVVIVNDGSIVVGDDYILEASDFEILVSEVNLSKDAIIDAANVRLYDLEGNLMSNNLIDITSTGNYAAIVGTYKIIFTSKDDAELIVEVEAKVTNGDSPVIDLPNEGKPVIVKTGTDFNPFDDVVVTDKEDDLKVVEINVWSNPSVINTEIPGVYKIKLHAEDSDNNITSVERIVIVTDSTVIPGDKYFIDAQNFTINYSAVFADAQVVKDLAKVKVYNVDGDVVDIPVNVDLGKYSNEVGTYQIKFTLDNNVKIMTEVSAKVIAGNVPVLEVQEYTEMRLGENFSPEQYIEKAEDGGGVDLIDKVSDDSITSLNMNLAGVYRVNYTLSNNDGNVVTARLVVVVKGPTVVIGDDYILSANDFTLRTGQVNVATEAIKNIAGVTVYSKDTGLAVDKVVNITDNGGYKGVVGEYDITFVVKDDAKLAIKIKATVTKGEFPVINFEALFNEVLLNANFDLADEVSAFDTEDGILNSRIYINPKEISTSKAGIQKFDYSVTDSDGNTVNKTKVILVNDGSYIVGEDLIINANDFNLSVSDVKKDDAMLKIAANVSLYDLQGNRLSNDLIKIVDNGGYTDAAGVYKIKFSAISDPNVSIEIVATVTAGDAPVIELPNDGKMVEIFVGESYNTFDGVKVTDLEDDAKKVKVNTWSDPVSIDTNVPGVYRVKLLAEDSDKNVTAVISYVIVKEKGTVVGEDYIITATDFYINYSKVILDDKIIKGLAKVVVTDLEGDDVDLNIKVNRGRYSKRIGKYDIRFTVDGYNTSTTLIKGNVIKANPPELEVEKYIELNKNDEFIAKKYIIKAYDIEDGEDLKDIVKDDSNTKLDTSKSGVYRVTYSLTDEDTNVVSAVLIVVVKGESVVISDHYIIKASDFELRLGQVNVNKDVIKANAKLEVYSKATGLKKVVDTEVITDYKKVIGEYDVKFKVKGDPAEITIKATVISGDAPIIGVDELFTVLSINENINLRDGVTASDRENGDLTKQLVVIPPEIDTSVSGFYSIVYTVTDSDGNTVNVKKSIVVKDEVVVVGKTHVISGHSYSIADVDVDASDIGVVKAANIRVYNIETGLEVFDTVTVIDKGNYKDEVGDYSLRFGTSAEESLNLDVMVSVYKESALPKTGKTVELLQIITLLAATLSVAALRKKIVNK